MGRTGKKLQTQVVRDIIYQVAKHNGIKLYKGQKKLISLILLTLPPRPNACHLSRWCKHDVTILLSLYPQFSAEAAIVRPAIGKELLYILNIKEFNRLKELINLEKPENIRPQWIRKKSYALYLAIKRGFRDQQGEVDWQFVFGKLGVDKFFRRRLNSYGHDKKKIIAKLEAILEEKNPKTFSPNWIYINTHGLDKHIANSFHGWSDLAMQLSKKWQQRWIDPNRREIVFYEGREEFESLYEKYKRNIYCLYAAQNKKDEQKRNEIVKDFLVIAQRGNIQAWDLLFDSLKCTICVDKQMSSWQNFSDALNQRIRSAIINFNPLKGNNFYAYLFKGLRSALPAAASKEAFSLNERQRGRGNNGQEKSERMVFPNSNNY